VFAVARGATGRSSAERTPEAVRGVVDAIARLDGHCDVILGGCGYFGAAWDALPHKPSTPTLLSALDLLDDALASSARDVAVLSMSGPAATDFVSGRPDAGRVRVIGLDGIGDCSKFAPSDWATNPAWTLAGLEAGLREVLEPAAAAGGALEGVASVLLECTVLPQFRSVIREFTSAPIVDAGLVVEH